MRHTGAVPQPQPFTLPTRSKGTLPKVVRWTLYVSSALAVSSGLIVWPVNVVELGGVHGLAGWFVIASLWTLAAIAARSGVSRSSVWLAIGWGLATALGAVAQYGTRPGSWITVLHVGTGIGAFVLGQHLLTRMRHSPDGRSRG